MSAEHLIASLLRVARDDLDGARLLADSGNRNAMYLCEQAAEKVIRAVVTSEGQHAGIRHQLDEMVDLVPDDNPLKARLRKTEHLAAYATTYRYPTPSGRVKQPPDATTVRTAIDLVERALEAAVAAFAVDLDDDAPARNRGPIR